MILFDPFCILQTFWELGPISILLLEPLKTTFVNRHFLCEALILLLEPFITKFKISFWNCILLLLPEIVKEFIIPLTIREQLLLSKV